MKISTLVFSLLAFFQFFSTQSLAYQEIEVEKGGVIKGKALLSGTIPPPRIYHEVLFPNMDLCSEVDTDDNMNRILNDFLVHEDGGAKQPKGCGHFYRACGCGESIPEGTGQNPIPGLQVFSRH